MEVSVIIPVYNAEKFIQKSVESALQQQETKEVILIEDGSPDNAFDVCIQLEKKYDRVQLYQHPNGENLGAGASRNLGIEKAKYPFIAFLDADDYYLPNRFQVTKQVFQKYPTCDGVYESIGAEFADPENERIYKQYKKPFTGIFRDDIPPNELFKRLITYSDGYFSLVGLTLKLNSIQGKFYFDTSLRLSQDTDFIFRISDQLELRSGIPDRIVANRYIHGENRILDRKKVNHHQKQLKYKWFLAIKNNNWPKEINRIFLDQYLVANGIVHPMAKRIKALIMAAKYPWLLKKII